MPIRRGTHPRVTSLRPTLEYALADHGTTCVQLRADGRQSRSLSSCKLSSYKIANALTDTGLVPTCRLVGGHSWRCWVARWVDSRFEKRVPVRLRLLTHPSDEDLSLGTPDLETGDEHGNLGKDGTFPWFFLTLWPLAHPKTVSSPPLPK